VIHERPLWLNSYRGKKEEAQEVQRYERGEGGGAGRAGYAQAGEARGEQEARKKRQAQTQPGQAAGRCGSGINQEGSLGSWPITFRLSSF
jgi:hypothetical protein